MHVNKVYRVRTIDRVAKDLDEDVEFLSTSPSKWSLRTV